MDHGVNGAADDAAGSHPCDPTDAALLAAIARRERDAFETLYFRHAPWLQVRLRRRCGDPDVVAEALQDTFLVVWRSAGRWDGRGEVPAWLWGIAIRRFVNLVTRVPHHDVFSAATDSAVGSAEEQVLLGVEYGDAAGALNRLSPELQAVCWPRTPVGASTSPGPPRSSSTCWVAAGAGARSPSSRIDPCWTGCGWTPRTSSTARRHRWASGS
jgi:RNA polymerase sigma-70 factor (ECF subfamily)